MPQGAPTGGKIISIDAPLKPSNAPDFGKWTDLTMMVMLDGRERSEDDFCRLFASAGFQLSRVVPVTEGTAIIEGVPV